MGQGQFLKGGGYFNQINFFLLKKTIVKKQTIFTIFKVFIFDEYGKIVDIIFKTICYIQNHITFTTLAMNERNSY